MKVRTYVDGTEFHRSVDTNVTFYSAKSLQGCTLHAIEPVLEYHFVETDFLTAIQGCQYWINAPSDIELPSSVASQYLLSFSFNVTGNTNTNEFYSLNISNGLYSLRYNFLSFRYQPVGVENYASVEVLNPAFYVNSPNEAQDKHYKENGDMLIAKNLLNSENAMRIMYKAKQNIWKGEMPIAEEADKVVVAVATLAVTVFSVACIALILTRKHIK